MNKQERATDTKSKECIDVEITLFKEESEIIYERFKQSLKSIIRIVKIDEDNDELIELE